MHNNDERNVKVLIVDDDKHQRELLVKILTRDKRFSCVVAKNGIEAYDFLFKPEKIDAVISDILMPGMDGFQLTMKLKSHKKFNRIPIILYSSTYIEEEDREFAYKIGADAFLKKPVPPNEIISELMRAIKLNHSKMIANKKINKDDLEDKYRLYSQRLIRKLEKKLFELQETNKIRLAAEKESKINQLKYRTVFDSANDTFLILDDKLIIDCNSKAYELFSLEKEDIIGKTFWNLSPDYQLSGRSSLTELNEKFDRVNGKKYVVFDWTILNKERELIDVEIGLSSFMLEGKKLYLMVIRDLTERKEASLKLRKAYREIKKLKEQLENENVYLKNEIKQSFNFENILTSNEYFKNLLHMVSRVAKSDSTVLLLGETGTGKELLARAIHQLSSRNKKALIKINCAALPGQLIESELFGYEKGAFTGAYQRKMGRFEMANGGTLFLDEIGDLPLELQTKLLRVLQEGEIEQIGRRSTIKVDVRIIAATNRNLEKMVDEGKFRQDLFYRLCVFPIKIPPLRERKEDIPVLVEHFVKKYSQKMGKKIDFISNSTIKSLVEYDWPGNVRELENIIERAVVISPGKKLIIGDWLKRDIKLPIKDFVTLEQLEKQYISKVLDHCKGKVSGKGGAAEILGMKPTTLQSRMKKLGLK